MDKRGIAIIIILIAGLACMYFVVINSTSVGSAVTIVDDVSVTLPQGFKIDVSYTNQAILLDEQTNETILVKYLSDGNNSLKEYNNEIKAIDKNETLEILDNSSNDTAHTLYCRNNDQDNNYSLTYFEKFDRTLLIKMENYDNPKKQNGDLMYIVDNLQPDYKQNRS
jgi:hypothetical protein